MYRLHRCMHLSKLNELYTYDLCVSLFVKSISIKYFLKKMYWRSVSFSIREFKHFYYIFRQVLVKAMKKMESIALNQRHGKEDISSRTMNLYFCTVYVAFSYIFISTL